VATGNNGSLRYRNITSILRLIYRNRPISRVELSRITGLNKATVSSLVAELIDRGFVEFVGENRSERAGRREVMIDISAGRASAVGVEIGVGFVSVIATDLLGRVLWRERIEYGHRLSPAAVIRKAIDYAARAIASVEKEWGPVKGIAVAVPGTVDLDSGALLFAPNLGWERIKVRDMFRERFDVPIYVDNEASLAALGEHFFGSARSFDEVLYVSAGMGIGGGIISGGRIFRGAAGIAGEFGHMTVDRNGEKCGCGRIGCWETIASETALFRAIEPSALGGEARIGSDMERLETIRLAAIAGKTPELNAVAEIGGNLATGLDSLSNIFDPQLIVLGGPLSSLHEILVPAIQAARIAKTPLVPASFGPDAALMGSVAHLILGILADPFDIGA